MNRKNASQTASSPIFQSQVVVKERAECKNGGQCYSEEAQRRQKTKHFIASLQTMPACSFFFLCKRLNSKNTKKSSSSLLRFRGVLVLTDRQS